MRDGGTMAWRSRVSVTWWSAAKAVPLVVPLAALAACQNPEATKATQAEFDQTCGFAGARCGHLVRPIDPAGGVPGTIRIGFLLYPRQDTRRPAAGTIMATEGGPGYPTSGTSEAYLELFRPLLVDHDLLLVDNRGTGLSQPIDCHELQTIPTPTAAAVGTCGRSLGHAADFYGTPLAADDIAAVLDALSIRTIALYGDSYGTFTAQIFAQRYPDRLRGLVLDGAFATYGESGFFPNTPAAIRRNLDAICARDPACHARPGTPLERAGRLLTQMRTAPIQGTAPDSQGHLVAATIDPAAVGMILYDATYDPVNLREFDPAVRAALDRGDPLPLLRLAAETKSHSDSRDPTGNAAIESYGLFAAVSCMDYPQIFDMTPSLKQRRAGQDAVLAAKRRDEPGLYAPLTIDEWRGLPLDYSTLDLCLDWPVDRPPYPPGHPVPQGGVFASVPTLILSGEFDTTTPPADAELAAAAFPNARHLLLANSLHVDALADDADCAAPIVRRFVASGYPGDVSCTARIPAIRPAADFVRQARDTAPATAAQGNAASPHDLAIAAAAAETAGDTIERTWRSSGDSGLGLRGGTFAIARSGERVKAVLDQVRWTEDLAVSGTTIRDKKTGEVRADLVLSGAGTGKLTIRWNEKEAAPKMLIAGTIGKRAVSAWGPAP
jgi:pimeloyl-ACP methyl ester carboxylesterase